jgi:hypothetical protein
VIILRALAREKRRAMLPERVGAEWTVAEDEKKLVMAFKAGSSELLAQTRQRTVRAVQARVERLQLVAVAENLKFMRFSGENKSPKGG